MTVVVRHWALALVSAFIALACSPALAFHSGGVGECEGCHSMHGTYEGSSNVTGLPQYHSGPFLLKARDQSGACLNCHSGPTLSSYHVDTTGVTRNVGTPENMTPGGDFSWLKKGPAFWPVQPGMYEGERKGHNIVAVDFGYVADTTLTTAPGGDYPAANLHCSSCHDPHGRTRRFADGTFGTTGLPIRNSGSYNGSNDPISNICGVGVYRILAGTGYQPKSLTGSFAFANQVPDAVAPSTYNRSEAGGQTYVAYGRGMSEWCGNCHVGLIMNSYTSGMGGLRHPAGNDANLTAAIVANYNAYVTSGRMTNTDVNAAYSTLTPFEIGTGDYAVLKARSGLNPAVDRSANTSNNVACVTCHRAHASGFESMLRFFYLNEFMTIGDAAGVAAYSPANSAIGAGLTEAQQQRAYYERPASAFGPWGRMQCNKCHAKD